MVDNVVREGEVVDAASRDPDVVGVRRMFELMAREPRLSATAIQTVGAKGWDGFALAVVSETRPAERRAVLNLGSIAQRTGTAIDFDRAAACLPVIQLGGI